MDLSEIARKLGLSEPKHFLFHAATGVWRAFVRAVDFLRFDPSFLAGRGLQGRNLLGNRREQVIFDRQAALKMSGVSEKAYNRSFISMQNGMGLKNTLDIRELAIQFGCVRLIPFVKKVLSLYKDRFLASLPASRRATANFTRPVFLALAFYLCAKKQKLKVDKIKLIELSGTSETEFASLSGLVRYTREGVIELQERAESSLLKEHIEAQAKELNLRMHQIEELEEKERLTNENIEGLMMDIATADEEIARWKVAAEQEADAGISVEKELIVKELQSIYFRL